MTSATSRATQEFAVKNTDFRSAIKKNVRATYLLIAALTALGCLLGYVCGLTAEVFTYEHPGLAQVSRDSAWIDRMIAILPSRWGGIGAFAMLLASLLATLFAFWKGDSALMHFSGARLADPRTERQLMNVVEEMALASGLPRPRVYIMETDALNAFATGLRPSQSSIAVTRGLLDKLNREELQAVVGHEMGHILNGDIRKAVALAVMVGLIVLVAQGMREIGLRMMLIAPSSSSRRDGNHPMTIPIGIVFLLLSLIAPLAAMILKMAVSRQREYLADATAVKLTRNPVAMASALRKISRYPIVSGATGATEHLFIVNPSTLAFDGEESWLSTHPSLRRRVARVLNLR